MVQEWRMITAAVISPATSNHGVDIASSYSVCELVRPYVDDLVRTAAHFDV